MKIFNNSKRISLALVLFAATVSTDVFADGRRDFYFQQARQRYFNQPENARTFGMAGSTVATSTDSSSVVGNPAGIGLMKGADLSFTYGHDTITGNEHPSYKDIEQTENSGQVLAAIPLGPVENDLPDYGNLGIGWSGYERDVDDSFDTESDGYRLTLAYAKAIDASTSLAYSLGYMNDDLENDLYNYSMDNGFRHTIGISNKYSEEMSWGASTFFGHGDRDVEIAGTPGDDGSSDLFEYGLNVGAGFRVAPETLLAISADYEYYDADGDVVAANEAIVHGGDEDGQVFNVRAGIEQTINEWLALRGGYRYAGLQDYDWDRDELDVLNGSAKHNVWTLGAGLTFPLDGYIQAVKLDYGVEFRSIADDDWQHVVTASVPMDVCK